MDADVDPREANQRGEEIDEDRQAGCQAGDHVRAREARRRVAGRERRGRRDVHQRLRVEHDCRRAVSLHRVLQDCGDDARRQRRGCDEQEDVRAAPRDRKRDRDRQPDARPRPRDRERGEDGVQPVDPVLDDPAVEAAVDGDQTGRAPRICLARSISCRGSKGFPMNPLAPRSTASPAEASSTWPLNMTTGIAPPCCS